MTNFPSPLNESQPNLSRVGQTKYNRKRRPILETSEICRVSGWGARMSLWGAPAHTTSDMAAK